MSETKNLRLFKHDNPSTNTNSFDVDTALNQNWDKIENFAGAVDSKIIELEDKNDEQDTTLEELKSENERLRKDLNTLPSGQASGETIDLTDSAEMRLKELKISGNSVQKTSTQSKNIFDPSKTIIFTVMNWSNTVVPEATNNTSVKVDENNYLSGTASSYLAVVCPFKFEKNKSIYNLSTNKSTIVYNSNGEAISLEDGDYTPAETFDGYIGIRINVDTNVNETYIMFSYDKNAEYEKFTPDMPSPKYASEVECSGDSGNINVEICNKNLEKTALIGAHSSPIITFEKYTGDLTIAMKPISGNAQLNYRFFYADGTAGGDAGIILANAENNKWYCMNVKVKDVIGIGTYNVVNSNYTYRVLEKQFIAKGNYSIKSDEDYVPHQSQTYTIPTQQPMRAKGAIRDTFIKKNNKWYERHYIARKIFNGTEDWYGNINSAWSQNEHVFGTPVSGIEDNGQSTNVGKILMSSHFICDNTGSLVAYKKDSISYYPAYKNGSIMINHQSISTITELKSWLQSEYNKGTPVYADCILKVPQDIECTMEQSIILDEIENKAKTYKGVTHICSTDDVGPNIEITYLKDLEIMINNAVGGGA